MNDVIHDRRSRSFRCEGIVLRHLDWGEADRILWLFTLEKGKMRMIAKGVRKARSRKSGHLEPFMRVNLLLSKGKDINFISQVDTINAYSCLREGLVLTSYASYIIELLDRFTIEEEENITLYRLLLDTLERLSDEKNQKELVLRYYEIRLLDLIGFRPQLFNCIVCNRQIEPEDQFFSVQLGGVVCPRCGKGTSGLLPVSMQSLKYLRHFQRSTYRDAIKAKLSKAINQEIENIMQLYFTYLLERKLNTPPFIRNAREDK